MNRLRKIKRDMERERNIPKYRFLVGLYRRGFGHVNDVYFRTRRGAAIYGRIIIRITSHSGYTLVDRKFGNVLLEMRGYCGP